ncbi:MAG: hypothetical protein QOJ65_816 [Fimbriimonadaceae bacterium]|nr:hypothetical protein [Fimbriimonadaceae bacterium]
MITSLVTAVLLAQAQKTPDATPVNLVAVTSLAKRKSWKPDGTPQKTWVSPDLIKRLDQSKSKSPEFLNLVGFVVQLKPKNAAEEPSVKFQINGQDLGMGYTIRDLTDKKIWWASASRDARKMPPTVDLKVGVGTGPWKVLGSHDIQGGPRSGVRFFQSIDRPHSRGVPAQSWVAIVHIPAKFRAAGPTRVKVFASDGSSLEPAGSGPSRPGGEPALYFKDNRKRLAKIVLQSRPYKWLTFKGVHTRSK